ncbi:MAG: glycosyltransferase family 39 protein [Victivallales bacterium]|nr:glycosyltransferase family 39 protein [Victivallales bacterium]
MAVYEETMPRRLTLAICLAVAFLLMYSPFQLGSWQLRRREDRYAAMAYEMDLSRPNTVVHGEQIPFHYPLYPWLVSLLLRFGIGMEFSLRVISVGSLAILTILAWEAGRRAVDERAGYVSAAMMFSSLIIFEKTLDGYPHMTGLLFLFSAWLAWFTYGVARGQWNRAWLISFTLCGLGFNTIGWAAIIFFAVPLVFMRRPMTVWAKLRKPGFFLGVALFFTFVMLWGVPRWLLGRDNPLQSIEVFPETFGDVALHLAWFPFDVLLRFFPWTLLAWPAFCVAFAAIDRNPIFSRFLRTIVISLFFLLWFLPLSDARNLIFLAPPISVLCGINYALLVRRHGKQLHGLLGIFSFGSAVAGVGVIIFYTTFFPWSLDIGFIPENLDFRDSHRVVGILQALLAVGMACYAIYMRRRGLTVMMHSLLVCVSFTLLFWAIHIPHRALLDEERCLGKAFAEALRGDLLLNSWEPLPSDLTVYKGPGVSGLVSPCLYMGAKVKKIYRLDELPGDVEKVYVIGTEYPVSPDRTWEYVTPKDIFDSPSDPYVYRGTRFYIFKGVRLSVKPPRNNGQL